MAAVTTPPYTPEELNSDNIGKMDIITFIQANASQQFQVDRKLKGAAKNVAKKKSKTELIADYDELFASKDFKLEGEVEISKVVKATEELSVKDKDEKGDAASTVQTYRKNTTKKGDKTNFPVKGDLVEVLYTGRLEDGTVFDSNVLGLRRGKKPIPLSVKIGVGKLIKGWDDALLTMSAGEKAEITIEPEFGYGKKPVLDDKGTVKIPPNSRLIFEVELHRISA